MAIPTIRGHVKSLAKARDVVWRRRDSIWRCERFALSQLISVREAHLDNLHSLFKKGIHFFDWDETEKNTSRVRQTVSALSREEELTSRERGVAWQRVGLPTVDLGLGALAETTRLHFVRSFARRDTNHRRSGGLWRPASAHHLLETCHRRLFRFPTSEGAFVLGVHTWWQHGFERQQKHPNGCHEPRQWPCHQ